MTEHIRTIPPWWFRPLWEGAVQWVWVCDDQRPALHAGDTLVMHDTSSRRRMRGEITHLYSGPEFADRNMVCVSLGRVAKLEARHAE